MKRARQFFYSSLLGVLLLMTSSFQLLKAQEAQAFSAGELDAILAPVALYPDALLAQVLMASTYPLEVVEADRWAKSKKLSGDAALKAAENERWDVSVKSLTPFPNLLDMMSAQLSWTQQMGDAFLAQEGEVIDAIQRLRQQAQKAGNLATSSQQTVSTQGQTIIIEPADPQVVYVPAYNPTVVYGTWAYPTYPPTYYPSVMNWYPGQSLVNGFMWGVGFSASRALFGGFGWHDRSVNVNVNRAVSIDRHVTHNNFSNGQWRHDSTHRGSVSYRDKRTGDRFSGTSNNRAVPLSDGNGLRAKAGDVKDQRSVKKERGLTKSKAADRIPEQPQTTSGSGKREAAKSRAAHKKADAPAKASAMPKPDRAAAKSAAASKKASGSAKKEAASAAKKRRSN